MAGAYLIIAWAIAQDPRAFWWLDHKIASQVNTWKKGTEPPAALLRFPDGPRIECGFSAPPTVHDYVSRIGNEDLLRSLLHHPNADAACIRATVHRLIRLKGIPAVREMLASAPKHGEPFKFISTEIAVLRELLNLPYAKFRVASIDKPDASKETAEKALKQLQELLENKESWQDAYAKVADDFPDPNGRGTLVRYAYDGIMSPTGFDLLCPQLSYQFVPAHLRQIFEAKPGVHRLESKERYWLYYVEWIDDPRR